MKKHKFVPLLLLFIALFFGFHLQAQTINEQFKTVVEGSNNYQDYKVINQKKISDLWRNTVDSLNSQETRYREITQRLKEQKSAIETQKIKLATKEKSLENTLNGANEISFLGIYNISKSTYRLFMWSLVVILAVLVVVFYFRAFSARKEAKYRIKLFDEVQEEFKTFKSKANESEKKLARALQDERNKLAEYNIH